jgi:DNA-binding response OmpR family regulator
MIRVLYVDDEEPLLELAKEFLEASNDMVLVTVNNALEGLKRVSDGGIEVVVSDYAMPEMDGLAFLRELRRSGNDIPYILFTGKGREEVVIQALNEGADSYLQKGGHPRPQFAELAHRINRAAERRQVVLALQQSESRLRRAEEIAGFGHWELHLDSKEMIASAGAKIIYGTDWTRKSYEAVKKIPLPEYRAPLDGAMADLIENGNPTISSSKSSAKSMARSWMFIRGRNMIQSAGSCSECFRTSRNGRSQKWRYTGRTTSSAPPMRRYPQPKRN